MRQPIRMDVNISKLHFDSENPRLPEEMDRSDEDAVLTWMLRKGEIIDLMASIGATGFSSAEAVLAVPLEGQSDEYEVVEGNRRLAAVKLLNAPEKANVRKGKVLETVNSATHHPSEIPVLIYGERKDILTYLGYRHITGIKAWGPEEKAKYLRQLYEHYASIMEDENEIFNTIAQTVATKPYYAKKTLATLALVETANEEAYWGLDRLTAEDVKFSVLGTALSYAPIVDYLELDDASDWKLNTLNKDKLKDLYQWLFQRDPDGNTKVRESRELPKLAKVVERPEALAAFKEGHSLAIAAELTDEADEAFKKFLVNAYQDLSMAQNQLKRVKNPNKSDLDTLRDLYQMAKDMGIAYKARIDGEQEASPF